MTKKSGCAVILLFLLLCLSLFINGILFLGLGLQKSMGGDHLAAFDEHLLVPGNSEDKIAVIPLAGVIAFDSPGALGDSLMEDLKTAFEQAERDPAVKAIVMTVDSPGGEVTASDVLYHEILQLKSKKPVIYFMNSMGTSGAYYAACGSSWIMCNETTFTGSIGVILSTLNYRVLFEKIGLEAVIFKSGEFKDMLNGARQMTPEEQLYVQALVMQSYEKFANIVSQSRQLSRESLHSVADGRVLSGLDAFQAHLVDQLGYVEDAYQQAKTRGHAEHAAIVRYERPFSWKSLLSIFGQAGEKHQVKVDLGLPKLKPGQAYFLPSVYCNSSWGM